MCLLLVAAAVAVLVPLAPADTGRPVPGRVYGYVKVLSKDPGFNSPGRKQNVVVVRTGLDGRSLEVAWGLWTGSGCSLRSSTGRRYDYLASVTLRTTLKEDGSFHAVDARPHGWRLDRKEAHGQFQGGVFALRLREKAYGVTPGGDVIRCDGRRLTFRARLAPPGTRLTPWG